ncbi:MAG: helix-turn-helix domain-containing protein [Chloroflexia bacterium]|nr:helix-turn-helix domain-containing protein [Chloroflexia bacterium]MDQ3327164.1 helix-turn-helix domain-containing protein [Chloroflexota bacterium]
MAWLRQVRIELTGRQRSELERIVRRHTSSQRLVRRARIVLACADGHSNARVSESVGVYREAVREWRARWLGEAERLGALESEAAGGEEVLSAAIAGVLADAPRSGTPATFTPEQVVQIVALACERPEESGRPVTHWTTPELAAEAVERGIVPSISPRSVGRFLGRGAPQAAPGEVLAH